MFTPKLPRLLCVDDDVNVLGALTRVLRQRYQVECADGSLCAIEVLRRSGEFAVVISDLRMPEMDGVTFLGQVRQLMPEAVRILLTGQADMDAAIAAVNHGNIFRFLTKPCQMDQLIESLDAAVEQHRLITSQRVLLEQTLRGSIKFLTDILAMVDPVAFGRATRVRRLVSDLAQHSGVTDRWSLEVAAMLSQVGHALLPRPTLQKLQKGLTLSPKEQEMVDRTRVFAEEFLADIPRLESVREILRYHRNSFDGAGQPTDGVSGEAIPWGARALKLALDLDELEWEEKLLVNPMDVLRGRGGWYDSTILEGLGHLRQNTARQDQVKELPLTDLELGMVFAEDVKSASGVVLISRGQEVTPSLRERLNNYASRLGAKESVLMIVRNPSRQT